MRQLYACFLLIIFVGLFSTAAGNASSASSSVPRINGAFFVNSNQALGGETGNGVALGDLDGDGDLDAFVANDHIPFSEANQVWFNDGNGHFTAGATLGTADGYAVALGDLDGDGDLDAIVAGVVPGQVWLNQGGAQGGTEGDFAAGVSFGSFTSYGIALGDVDNDGDLDALVVGNSNQVWLNNGDATFAAGPALPFQFSRSVVLADLDGDGWLDAIIADSAEGSNNRVWWNDGNWNPGPGSFTAGDLLPTTGLINSVAVANLDGDSQPDIFLAGSGPNQIFWNEGSRVFSTAGPLPVSDNSWAVALADVDGDGRLDAVVGNVHADPIRLWRNEGGRIFTIGQEFGNESGLYWSRGLGLADLNGDSAADLFEVTTAEDRVWLNQGAPPVIPNEVGWQLQLLEARGNTGLLPAMALDGNGYPHITYVSSYANGYDEQIGQYTYAATLYYTTWTGVAWHTATVRGPLESVESVSLAVGGNGDPHIAYVMEDGNSRLRYAYWDGITWQDAPLPGGADGYAHQVSLTLDASDNPHLTYTLYDFATSSWQLKYSVWDGAAWQTETVDNSFNRSPSSLALDAGGNPHVAYISCSTAPAKCGTGLELLKYARKSGGAWQTESLDDSVNRYVALALDDDSRPHIAYHTYGPYPPGLKYVYWDGSEWQHQFIVDPGGTSGSVSLDLDSSRNPHIFYVSTSIFYGTRFHYASWDSAEWQIEILDHSSNTSHDKLSSLTLALDENDIVHATYYEPEFGDLRYLTWAPNWQRRTVEQIGSFRSPAIDLKQDSPVIAYYNETSGQVKVARWDAGWALAPLAFVASPVTDLSLAVGPVRAEHVSYYDADNQRLMYRRWNGLTWITQIIDEVGDVGRYNDLTLAGGAPHVAYWDATGLRVKVAVPALGAGFWHIYPNNASPPLNAESGSLSAALLPGGDVGVAYYDGANGDLRLAVWDAETTTWADELVAGMSSDAGRLNAIQTDGTDGAPVLVYFEAGELRMAYKVGGLWNYETAVPGLAGESLTGLSLELGLNSRQRARIAYTTSAGGLYIASLRDGVWQIEVVDDMGDVAGEVSAVRDSRLHLAYTHSTQGLQHAFRTATVDVDTSVPGEPPPAYFLDGSYNPLDACMADLLAGDSIAGFNAYAMTPPFPLPHNEGEPGDPVIFEAMNSLFAATSGGQHYINLYRNHGSEMGLLGLNDPGLLWDAFGTLQNFLPGLEALVTGRGDEILVTQGMVDDALDIWQRLAAAGSPELASVIQSEQARYNNLQDFVGLTFNEWALTIGVNPPPKIVYLPVIRKD